MKRYRKFFSLTIFIFVDAIAEHFWPPQLVTDMLAFGEISFGPRTRITDHAGALAGIFRSPKWAATLVDDLARSALLAARNQGQKRVQIRACEP